MSEYIPASLIEFYADQPTYAAQRQKDADLALKYGLFEKVMLKRIKYEASGYTDVPARAYNWFYNRVGTAHDLAYVISPDARLPNYSTHLADVLELAILSGLQSIPVPSTSGSRGMDEMLQYILNHV